MERFVFFFVPLFFKRTLQTSFYKMAFLQYDLVVAAVDLPLRRTRGRRPPLSVEDAPPRPAVPRQSSRKPLVKPRRTRKRTFAGGRLPE